MLPPAGSFLVLALLPSMAIAGVWPSFSVLKRKYPSYTKYKNQQMLAKAGLGDNVYGQPTSALRVSYALIHAGRDIDISEGECNWSGKTGFRNGGKKYIIHADTMRCWLEKTKGQATVKSRNKLHFQGKRPGIIVFENCPGFLGHITGHVDLWDGNDCLVGCYDCEDIRLFSFL